MTLPKLLNTAYFRSVTFGHHPPDLVTFGHLFRGLLYPTDFNSNSLTINSFDCLIQLTIANNTLTTIRGTKRAATSQLFLRLISSIDWGPNPPDPLGRPSASESSLQTLYRVLFFVSPKFGRIWSLFSPRLKNRETDKLEFIRQFYRASETRDICILTCQ